MGWFDGSSDQAAAYDQVSSFLISSHRHGTDITRRSRSSTPPTRPSSLTSSSLPLLPTRFVVDRPYRLRRSRSSPLYSFQAAKAYENHVAENGKPDSHAKAKEIAASLAGAFIDRIVETKGVRCDVSGIPNSIVTDHSSHSQLDFIDKERAKRQSQEQIEEVVTVDNY